ncbi:MAG TPA: hypothetical protein VNO31_23335 [Umezawaea sp.]|nr:hypothetical protein [Umezawaea sp.]
MTQIVSVIPVIVEQTGRAVVLVGGLAVMCRLSTPYRATTDLDTVDRRSEDQASQLQLLVAAGATPSGPAGALVRTPWGEVQVDVLEVTDADVDDLPDDPTGRLHIQSHSWAASTASALVLRAEGLPPLTGRVAEPGPLIAMKLQAVMDRGAAKAGRISWTSCASRSIGPAGRCREISSNRRMPSCARTRSSTPGSGSIGGKVKL